MFTQLVIAVNLLKMVSLFSSVSSEEEIVSSGTQSLYTLEEFYFQYLCSSKVNLNRCCRWSPPVQHKRKAALHCWYMSFSADTAKAAVYILFSENGESWAPRGEHPRQVPIKPDLSVQSGSYPLTTIAAWILVGQLSEPQNRARVI